MRVNHKETGTSDGGKPPRNAEPIRLLLCRKADSGARESPAVRSAGGATLLALPPGIRLGNRQRAIDETSRRELVSVLNIGHDSGGTECETQPHYCRSARAWR
jgi:hypothetical protein